MALKMPLISGASQGSELPLPQAVAPCLRFGAKGVGSSKKAAGNGILLIITQLLLKCF
jgi:hypothetical protein